MATTVLMSDTHCQPAELSPTQQSKVGFPLAKLVVWFCVTTEPFWKLQWQLYHQ